MDRLPVHLILDHPRASCRARSGPKTRGSPSVARAWATAGMCGYGSRVALRLPGRTRPTGLKT